MNEKRENWREYWLGQIQRGGHRFYVDLDIVHEDELQDWAGQFGPDVQFKMLEVTGPTGHPFYRFSSAYHGVLVNLLTEYADLT